LEDDLKRAPLSERLRGVGEDEFDALQDALVDALHGVWPHVDTSTIHFKNGYFSLVCVETTDEIPLRTFEQVAHEILGINMCASVGTSFYGISERRRHVYLLPL
jgi:hypothetical protein